MLKVLSIFLVKKRWRAELEAISLKRKFNVCEQKGSIKDMVTVKHQI